MAATTVPDPLDPLRRQQQGLGLPVPNSGGVSTGTTAPLAQRPVQAPAVAAIPGPAAAPKPAPVPVSTNPAVPNPANPKTAPVTPATPAPLPATVGPPIGPAQPAAAAATPEA